RTQTEYALVGKLLLFSLWQVQCRIGEIQRAVGADDDIVRAVEPLAFVLVGEHRVFAVGIYANDRAQNARGGHQPALRIQRAAIGVADFKDRFDAPIGIHARQLVLLFVADVEEALWIPYGPLGESEAARDLFELRVSRDQVPELRRLGFQFELSRRRG